MAIEKFISDLVRPEVQKLAAYHVPESGDMIKLDAMENPYSLPDEIKTKLAEILKDTSVNRYPDPASSYLIKTIKKEMGISDEFEVLLGNGSDELILLIMLALSGKNRSILAPSPTFVMYKISALTTGYDFIDVSLKDDFSLDMQAMINQIEENNPTIIFLAHPNNPTGNKFKKEEIIKIIETANGLVVVDEAYFPFADYSFLDDLKDYDNVILLRTVSKMGLAGVRLGFMVAKPEWVEQINKVRMPYNINVLTQTAVSLILSHRNILDEQTQRICKDREILKESLESFDDLTVYPSQANFLLFKTGEGDADKLFEFLEQNGVLIKNLSGSGGLLKDCLRVTVGTESENSKFLEIVKSFYS